MPRRQHGTGRADGGDSGETPHFCKKRQRACKGSWKAREECAIGVAQEFQNVFAAAQRQGSNGIPWFSFTKADRLSWRRGRIGSGRGRFDA